MSIQALGVDVVARPGSAAPRLGPGHQLLGTRACLLIPIVLIGELGQLASQESADGRASLRRDDPRAPDDFLVQLEGQV
jgi:hypothetical protein